MDDELGCAVEEAEVPFDVAVIIAGGGGQVEIVGGGGEPCGDVWSGLAGAFVGYFAGDEHAGVFGFEKGFGLRSGVCLSLGELVCLFINVDGLEGVE